jgi:DNA-binding NarL/FixJ family response regulator
VDSWPLPKYATVRFLISRPPQWALLTDAEAEVVRLALAGLGNAEIARRRGTCERTVANQLASIFRKLGVASRSELAVAALSRTG